MVERIEWLGAVESLSGKEGEGGGKVEEREKEVGKRGGKRERWRGDRGGGKVIMYDFHLIICRYESGARK